MASFSQSLRNAPGESVNVRDLDSKATLEIRDLVSLTTKKQVDGTFIRDIELLDLDI